MRDQRLGALGDRLALQVHHAVLGDDVHHVGARRGDDVAGRQRRDDAAPRARRPSRRSTRGR